MGSTFKTNNSLYSETKKREAIVIFIEAILMVVFVTLVMDYMAGYFAIWGFMRSFISHEAIGRWFIYMFKGKFNGGFYET